MTQPDIAPLLQGAVVDALSHDAEIVDELFSDRPAVHEWDTRVYAAQAELPAVLAEVLPRIIVSVRETPWDTEQEEAESTTPSASCQVWVHVLTESARESQGQRLAARARSILVSTPLSDARIITSKLWVTGYRVDREPQFRDAHRVTREFGALAGVR